MRTQATHRFLAMASFILSSSILLAAVGRVLAGPQNFLDITMQVFAAFIFGIYSVIYSVPDDPEEDDSMPTTTRSHLERERIYGRRGF